MTYDDAVAVLRCWETTPVVVELEPEGTVMRGQLSELDAAGIDGVLFSLGAAPGERATTGVAIALFRDSVRSAERRAGALVVEQGRVTVTVRPADDAPGAA